MRFFLKYFHIYKLTPYSTDIDYYNGFAPWLQYIQEAKVQFEKDIAGILSVCDEYEVRMIKDMVQALKATLRRDANLRK